MMGISEAAAVDVQDCWRKKEKERREQRGGWS